MPLPGRGRPNPRKPGPPDGGIPRFGPPRKRRIVTRQASSGMDPSTLKYLIFGLIFVVGNIILFFSTGFIIIPR
ncbi:MAG: hypothetical protein HY293_05890 [Planctomycetes bacterium]|nr:hypothetical protein [Planctomycetota bacterium]